MMQSLFAFSALVLLSLAISACSPSKNSSQPVISTVQSIHGFVEATNVTNATLYAVPVDAQGQPKLEDDGSSYEGFNADISDGRYSVSVRDDNIKGNKMMVFIVNGKEKNLSRQRCEWQAGCLDSQGQIVSFGNSVSLSSDDYKLTAAVLKLAATSQISVNWITHLAATLAHDTIGLPAGNHNGAFSQYSIEKANLWLARQFTLTNILELKPTSPSNLVSAQEVGLALQAESIYYGALLSAGQALAKENSQKINEWISSVAAQQSNLRGRLYKNSNTEFSLCGLFGKAEVLLNHAQGAQKLDGGISQAVGSALSKIREIKTANCSAADGDLTAIEIQDSELTTTDWAQRFTQGKAFIEDLNSRLENIRCEQEGQAGFFNCDYVKETQAYYDDLKMLYNDNQVAMDDFIQALNTDILAFIDACNASNNCASYSHDGLTYTLYKSTPSTDKSQEGKYHAFDFRLTGTRQVSNDLTVTFKGLDSSIKAEDVKDEDYNYIRVVFVEPYAKAPKFAMASDNAPNTVPTEAQGVEPLGFDVNWPNIQIKNSKSSTQQDMDLYVKVKLLGVKPVFAEPKLPFHYNLSELGVGLKVQSDLIGTINQYNNATGKTDTIELKDTAEITLNGRFNDAGNFYAQHVWPNKEDFFSSERSGIDKASRDAIASKLFAYKLAKEQKILLVAEEDKNGNLSKKYVEGASYLELSVAGVGTNRFELLKTDDKLGLRKCSINDLGEENDFDTIELAKVCTSLAEVKAGFDLVKDLINAEDEEYFEAFSIPAYGAYQPKNIKSITWNTPEGNLDGELIAEFSQGVSNLNLLIGQEFVEGTGADAKAKPKAILKLNANKETATRWEVAMSLGYNYDYLIEHIAGGKNVESMYVSYYVNEVEREAGKSYVNELGSLQVLRGGVTLFDSKGEQIGATLAGSSHYPTDEQGNLLCGVTSTGTGHSANCEVKGYLTYQGYLIGVLYQDSNNSFKLHYANGEETTLSFLSAWRTQAQGG